MIPTTICNTSSAHTTQKYLIVASCDGDGDMPSSGSACGTASGGSSSRRLACQNAIAPMPPRSTMMLTPVHTSASEVGLLSISGSCGQLLVYVTLSSGRFVAAAHAEQKKNADSWRAR